MAKCSVCGKKPMSGNNVSFSQKKTRRKWKPNVQTATIMQDGQLQKVKICSRCLRTAIKT